MEEVVMDEQGEKAVEALFEEEGQPEGELEGNDAAADENNAETPAGGAVEEAVVEPEPTHVYHIAANRARPAPGSTAFYVHLPVALGVEHKAYNEDRLRQTLEAGSSHLDATRRTQLEHPWRVIRTRTKRGPTGEAQVESNARIVRWEDGSEHLFIGDSVVYQITKQKIRRGVNDLYALNPSSGEAEFWSPFDQKLVFKLLREPGLRPAREDKKQRKVKLVGVKDDRQEEEAELQRVKAASKLSQARARKDRASSTRDFDSAFLEEGAAYVDQPNADDEGFIDDATTTRAKRSRSAVNEAKLLDAKRRSGSKSQRKREEEEEDEDEDEDEDDGDAGAMADVVDDDDSDTGGGGEDDGLQLYDD